MISAALFHHNRSAVIDRVADQYDSLIALAGPETAGFQNSFSTSYSVITKTHISKYHV